MLSKRNLIKFGIFLAIVTPFAIKTNNNNTCIGYFDYFLINFSQNCYYNPDVDSNVTEIIRKYSTKNVQTYNFTTEDGYILTMFRIYRDNPQGVVVLQPPITSGSISWLADGPDSLAILLWKKGYDVWLPNPRGTRYSRNHVNLTVSDEKFWDFSFHEIALYDLNAEFELIHQQTNSSQILYVGYSVASTEALVYASLRSENSLKFVKNYILIAPLATLNGVSSPLMTYVYYLTSSLASLFRMGEFATLETLRHLVHYFNIEPYVIDLVKYVLVGKSKHAVDPELFPFIFSHHGYGLSIKLLYHYRQIYLNQTNFLMFDYGERVDRIMYGSDSPPSYPLDNIKNSVYIIYGENDTLATPSDAELLCQKLLPKETVSGCYKVSDTDHADFLFGFERVTKIYPMIYSLLDKISS